MTHRQLHVRRGARIQTLEAREGVAGGVTLCSALGTDNGLLLAEIHVSAEARAWLITVLGGQRPAPVVPPLDALRREADAGRTCRLCGCTDDDCSGCIERTGEPCHWVGSDLCSACLPGRLA